MELGGKNGASRKRLDSDLRDIRNGGLAHADFSVDSCGAVFGFFDCVLVVLQLDLLLVRVDISVGMVNKLLSVCK